MSDGPLYLVQVCPNCVAIRHFKPKGNSDIYYCPVCGFKVSYNDGAITNIGIPKKFNKIINEPLQEPLYKIQQRLRNSNSKSKGVVRNPYGRRGRPKYE